MAMRESLSRLRAGEASFDAFWAETGGEWRRLAATILARWQTPSDVAIEDVEQELLIGAWEAVGSWDPSRGVEIERHVVWRALDRARKWVHKRRGALRRDGRSPSRIATRISPESMERRFTVAANQIGAVALGEAIEAAGRCGEAERIALELLLTHGDVVEACAALLADPRLRSRTGVETKADARVLMKKIVEAMRSAA